MSALVLFTFQVNAKNKISQENIKCIGGENVEDGLHQDNPSMVQQDELLALVNHFLGR